MKESKAEQKREERDIRAVFDIALALKALGSALELVGGVLILFISPHLVVRFADIVTQGELAKDPDDLVSNWLVGTAHSFSIHTHYLLAAYLILRGVVKLGFIGLIWKNVLPAYLWFVAVLAVFVSYESYRAATTGNWFLVALAVFDLILILLTSHEYRARRAQGAR